MAHTVRLAGSDRAFTVEPGESVLDGARRAGLALPYSCLTGRCGSCKATIVEGECRYPNAQPVGLDAAESARHEALLCQAVPVGDLVIAAREVPSVADFPRRVLAVKVVEKTLVAPDVVRLALRAARGERLRWLAGQYIDVLVDGGKRRAFSIANAPEDNAQIELHIRHVTGGGFTDWVFRELAVGAVLRIEGPLGTFVPREDSEAPMLFVAGGTGFAPVKAIVEHFLHLGTRRAISVYWGVRNDAEFYLPDIATQWRARKPDLAFVPVYSEAAPDGARGGWVHEAVLADHPNLAAHDLYMSGPPALIDAGRRGFVQAGLDPARLYYDSFEYAPDVLAAILRGRAGIGDPPA